MGAWVGREGEGLWWVGRQGGRGSAGAASAPHTRLPISLKEHVRRENTDNQCQIS